MHDDTEYDGPGPDRFAQSYLRYDALVDVLEEMAAARPDLMRLETIGTSHEGRDIPLAIVTAPTRHPSGNPRDHTEKPAFWLDGNIHATELAPSTACLMLLHHLLVGHGTDADATRALETRTFYVCPRVNPDGAELALAETPRFIRSSTRSWPLEPPAEHLESLEIQDVDGDGRVLAMRIVDPDGPWKVSERDPRLLVRREPTETGGTYYRVLPEGRLGEQWDGVTLRVARPREGLDLNRNFPAHWRIESKQKGAGPYPASEPEVRTIVDFIADHPNITAGVTFHTWGRLLLRPFSHRPDEDFPTADLRVYERLGKQGKEMTGYPPASVFHDFRYDPKGVITGAFDDWLFEHRGVFGWTVEIWSALHAAGVETDDILAWRREHPIEDDIALLRWADETIDDPDEGYVEWYPFEHPELGEVELGGWNNLRAIRNPPPSCLETEVERFAPWLVWHALVSPELVIREASATRVGPAIWRVRLVVANAGWLPTHVTEWARDKKIVRGVRCTISLSDGCELVGGEKQTTDVGQLGGRSQKAVTPDGTRGDPTIERARVDWLVRVPASDAPEDVRHVRVSASHPRAGRVEDLVSLVGDDDTGATE